MTGRLYGYLRPRDVSAEALCESAHKPLPRKRQEPPCHDGPPGRRQKPSAANRRRFRERADGVVDTSIGDYPCHWPPVHVAAELATHADDIGVPVAPGEQPERTAWRAGYSRFALAEAKPQLEVRRAGARTAVTGGPATVELDDDELIEAVMGRLDQTSGFSAELRALSSMLP